MDTQRTVSDTQALDIIAEWLRDPEWGTGMLMDQQGEQLDQRGEQPERWPLCPVCGQTWDFTRPGRAECDAGHEWDQAPAFPGTFVRPGHLGDLADFERWPDEDEDSRQNEREDQPVNLSRESSRETVGAFLAERYGTDTVSAEMTDAVMGALAALPAVPGGSYQVRAADLAGNAHDERWTTSLQEAAAKVAALYLDPQVQRAWIDVLPPS